MFFKTKKKNRRLDHDFVLDVKLRSTQVRARRWRVTLTISGVTALGLCLLFGVWRGGQWMMDRLLYSNSAFAIRDVEIQTDGAFLVDQLRRWTQARPGENLLALDMARVKRDLEMIPYIKAATVERILPHTVKVKVYEREPVAQTFSTEVRASGEFTNRVYQFDETGRVMLPLELRWRTAPPVYSPADLPILTGLNPADLVSGRRLDSPALLAALDFIVQFNRSSMSSYVDLQWVDLSSPDLLQVHTRQGSDITFATEDYDTQLRRWQQIHELYWHSHKLITVLDLSISNNIPLRWAEANGVPAPLPKPPHTSKLRRKNV